MTRDPNIESFFAILEDEEFEPAKLIDDEGGADNLQEILWYMNESRVDQICDELNQKDDARRTRVIQNVARLYPMSRALLYKILSRIRGSDYYVMRGVDLNGQLLNLIKQLLDDIASQTGKTTKRFQDYRRDVENRKNEVETLRAASEQFKELKDERDRLDREIEQLRREADSGSLTRDIEALKDEELELRNRLRQNQADYDKRHATVNELKLELQSMQSRLDSGEELRLLRDLLEKFPPDAEDEK